MPHPRRYRDEPIRDAGMALATLGGGESDSDGVRLEATSYPPYLCRYHRSRPVLSGRAQCYVRYAVKAVSTAF